MKCVCACASVRITADAPRALFFVCPCVWFVNERERLRGGVLLLNASQIVVFLIIQILNKQLQNYDRMTAVEA